MIEKITSTELKLKTKEVLDKVERGRQPMIIYTYKEPKAVILNYQDWEKADTQGNNPSPEELKKHFIKLGKKIDTAKIIRKLRDEE